MIMRKSWIGVVILSITGVLFMSCPLTPSLGQGGTGKLSIVMQTSGGARTILPVISVASYRISFSGPAAHDPLSTTQVNPTVELEAGTWSLGVEGLDSGGATVVVGTAGGVVVSAGSTTSVSIVLSAQASGNGTIDVQVSWPGPGTVSPPIDAVETTLAGDAVPGGTVSFSSGATTMRYVQVMAADSYELCITLKSGGVLRAIVQEAVQVYGNLTSSAAIELRVADFTQVPVAPSNLTVTEGLAKVDLGWVDNSNVETGYVVERGTAEGGPFAALSLAANTTSYSDTTVTAGTPYWYRVEARNQIGDSDPLSAGSAVMVAAPVAGGSGTLSYSDVTTSSIRVNWQKATDNVSAQAVLQYKVVRSLSNNIATAAQAQANGTVVMDWSTDAATANATGLSAGTAYWFNVLVRDAPGNTGAYLSSCPPGSLELTITVTTPQDQTITFNQVDDIVVDFGSTLTVTIGETFDSYSWNLDGATLSGQSAATVSINSGTLALGVHHLAAFVVKNGLLYSKTVRFVVWN
jgi:hypothetical protein